MFHKEFPPFIERCPNTRVGTPEFNQPTNHKVNGDQTDNL